ncbi:hypothetical protein [Marinobacter adhaerens]|uniref:hypothetical protein n=1 Tax=Marinobacter adhaerens TaxID=1033846 RepID=UPI003D2AFD8C
MTIKSPEQRIAELDRRRRAIEAKLKAERAAIIRAQRREHAKILNQKRKEDTRRKILIGALRFDQIARLSDEEEQKLEKLRLKEEMNRFLIRKDDRKLFGLEPLSEPQKRQINN